MSSISGPSSYNSEIQTCDTLIVELSVSDKYDLLKMAQPSFDKRLMSMGQLNKPNNRDQGPQHGIGRATFLARHPDSYKKEVDYEELGQMADWDEDSVVTVKK